LLHIHSRTSRDVSADARLAVAFDTAMIAVATRQHL
jgi:hypothetical protein